MAMHWKLRSRKQEDTVIISEMKTVKEMQKVNFILISLPYSYVRLYQSEGIPARGFMRASCHQDSAPGDQ